MTDRTRLALGAVAGVLLAAPATAAAAPVAVTLRVEGASQTTYEGSVTTDGHNVTTASGGTHKCDGTNHGQPGGPGPTGTAALDDAARLGGFTWDATYDTSFDDYLINRVGPDSQTSSQFWALLVNSQFSQTGGCQQRVAQGDEVLWAFDGFSKQHVLRLAGPGSARTGEPVSVTVTDGQDGSKLSGASVNGSVSGTDGRATLAFRDPGIYVLKAERADSIRSNALRLCVDPAGAPACTSTDKSAPAVKVLLDGSYASDSSRSRTILLAWQGDDSSGGSGISGYGLDARELGAGASRADVDWRTVVNSTPFPRAHFRGSSGKAYQFRVRAFDRAGNRGEGTSGTVVIPVDDRDGQLLLFSDGWRRLERKSAWGRTVMRSRRTGATARMRFNGSRVALIGRRLPKGGRLGVTVDGHSRTVRLRGKPRYRQVLFVSSGLRAGSHRLRLVAAGGGPVEIDAVASAP